ncbi:methyltransferase family protein [Asanoa ferruginea]|uniref:Methyltransferase family protein n=1 Tax=Asanoa ferruginea TaxID=53367 RepID=A0A3D9ZSB8_9ACTN|nr:class I SAM-dependent methyltransferase [Asanoa ferruginea]REF98883.1 methyltransferase family protein [Asanoa ferruginea]GIF46435.1 methyltransferase type 11 [Asanoa ferruginea]
MAELAAITADREIDDDGWQEFFSHPQFLRFSSAILTAERTAAEVAAVRRWLGPPSGASLLDLGCGYGRIAVPLAAAGYRVTGLDANAAMLAKAAADAEAAGVAIDFVHRDMREMALPAESFDAVLNLSTAFGYADDADGDLATLEAVRTVLRPAGLFLIDTENRDAKIRTARSTSFAMAGVKITCRRDFDPLTGRWREAMSWTDGDATDGSVFSVRLYSATELTTMLRRAGLQLVGAWGGFDGQPYTIDSGRMIMLARRA